MVLKFLCAVLPNSSQHDIRADLQPSDMVALSAERKSRVHNGIELFVSYPSFISSSENMRMRRRNTWDTVKYKSGNQ